MVPAESGAASDPPAGAAAAPQHDKNLHPRLQRAAERAQTKVEATGIMTNCFWRRILATGFEVRQA